MFEESWIDELTASEAADELARARDLFRAAEATQFALAAHWADLHAPEVVEDIRRSLPGMPRVVSCGPDGCPEIEEYAGAELAALLGRSTASGEQLIRDAVTVRHRHPLLWAAIRDGRVPVWLAIQVARRCVRAELTAGPARWVDAQTTRYATTLPPGRFLDLVDATIIAADPDAAAERARTRALARFVRAGRTDEDGLRTLVARASAGDVTYLVAVLDRLALFPYGTLPSRKADDDHVDPYVPRDRGGPPGQTRLTNHAKLSRFHHRLKTNGGWTLRHPEPGVYLWRTPHGHWFRLDAEGTTHHHGRDPALDTRWLEQPNAA